MRESETTNGLLLLILIVLLVGFGFIVPILWVVGGILGLWLLVMILRAISSGIGSVIDAIGKLLVQFFSPVWKLLVQFFFPVRIVVSRVWIAVSRFFRNDIVQWCFITIAACIFVWFYYVTGEFVYQVALMFLISVRSVQSNKSLGHNYNS